MCVNTPKLCVLEQKCIKHFSADASEICTSQQVQKAHCYDK